MPNTSLDTVDGWAIPFEPAWLSAPRRNPPLRPPRLLLLDRKGPDPWALACSFSLLVLSLIALCILGQATRTPRTAMDLQRSAVLIRFPSILPEVSSARKQKPLARRGKHQRIHQIETEAGEHGGSAVPTATSEAHALLGSVTLREIVHGEKSLAAEFTALPPEERVTFPRVYIRVNSEWVQALPETGEKLYFSSSTPTKGGMALTYDPSSGRFVLDQVSTPLWRVENPGVVSGLDRLMAEAALQLGLPAGLIQVFTWHPTDFENAIKAVILRRISDSATVPAEIDSVTVSFRSTDRGYVLDLDPISRTRLQKS